MIFVFFIYFKACKKPDMNNMLFLVNISRKLQQQKMLFQNQGTCFLFHCGPSQDFRCKFTHHGNYTSAVLTPEIKRDEPTKAVNNYPAQIAPVALSQHEMELSSLKDKPHRYCMHVIHSI